MENFEPNIELNSKKIIDTLNLLHERVKERFPSSGLEKVSVTLQEIAGDLNQKIEKLDRPILWVRFLIITLLMIILLATGTAIYKVQIPDTFNFSDFIQTLEAGINDIILIGVGIFFLVTLEDRIKRKKALKSLHRLRSIAHVIDMHQLTKDPEKMLKGDILTASSPIITMTPFLLGRYLNYCSEMLSLVSKLAALYLKHLDDPTVLESVTEIEDLTTGLSGKIWQKLNILNIIAANSK